MEENIKLGSKAFDKMMFTLAEPVTEANHDKFHFEDYEMMEIAPKIWAMPVYMTEDDDFTLFFIITKIDTGETVMAFSQGVSELDGDFNLSQPMNTGAGLNLLDKHDNQRAKAVLNYLDQLEKDDKGAWRIVADNKEN
ncbi:hypothetical protein ACQW5G_02190 [Fructilactobacillus sp. Tb1]|uniref:hypothetical protein n=1 Tax=Fructilactobacillus sp. Tb1 TaxID=3422304 RepID=UPI003D2E9A9F